jgi:hypothetical protein
VNKKWKCVCGYIHDGDNPPANCPKCGAPAEKFTLLDDAAAELVERSRRTNALHCCLVHVARKMEHVCKDGIEDALDPNCVAVFQQSLNHCYEIMKMSMTEMAGHASKNKWG